MSQTSNQIENQKYLQMSGNKNTTYLKVWIIAKEIHRKKYREFNDYIRKEGGAEINFFSFPI